MVTKDTTDKEGTREKGKFSPQVLFTKEQWTKAKTLTCPKIVLKGWWWKKYFPYYRKRSELMNKWMMLHWKNGGMEKYMDAHYEAIKHGIMYGFPQE